MRKVNLVTSIDPPVIRPGFERPEERREVTPRGFVNELKSVVSSTPVKLLKVVGEEAKEFRPLEEVAKAVSAELKITEENAMKLLRLLIMLRLVEYDDVEEKIRSWEPITRFIARVEWGITVLDMLLGV